MAKAKRTKKGVPTLAVLLGLGAFGVALYYATKPPSAKLATGAPPKSTLEIPSGRSGSTTAQGGPFSDAVQPPGAPHPTPLTPPPKA